MLLLSPRPLKCSCKWKLHCYICYCLSVASSVIYLEICNPNLEYQIRYWLCDPLLLSWLVHFPTYSLFHRCTSGSLNDMQTGTIRMLKKPKYINASHTLPMTIVHSTIMYSVLAPMNFIQYAGGILHLLCLQKMPLHSVHTTSLRNTLLIGRTTLLMIGQMAEQPYVFKK